jgi:hypothetical protein
MTKHVIKHVIAALFSMLFLLNGSHASPREVLLKVPVRVYTGSGGQAGYLTGLSRADFSFHINGKQRDIKDFTAHRRSLGSPSPAEPGTGRAIVLSFDTSAHAKPLTEAVSGFVREVLEPGDLLLLRTPADLYTIEGKNRKAKILRSLPTILGTELLLRHRNRSAAIEKLDRLMESIETRLDRKKTGIRSAMLFANHFHEEWRQFYKTFFLANLEHYSQLAGRLASHKGEKWLIHFQDRDILPMWEKFRRIKKKLKRFADSLSKGGRTGAKLLTETLDKVERSMTFAGEFPMEELLNNLLGVNMGCHVVFLGDAPGASASPGYETILSVISRQTGGIPLEAKAEAGSIASALKRIDNHSDFFYDVVFAFNGVPEHKTLDLRVNRQNAQTYYKKSFNKDEFNWLMEHLDIAELEVTKVSLENRKLAFTIAGYRRAKADGKSGGSGIIKVDIRLLDSTGSAIYHTGQTLNASGPTVNISLNLPEKHSGYFKLSITAADTLTGKSAQFNKYVKL